VVVKFNFFPLILLDLLLVYLEIKLQLIMIQEKMKFKANKCKNLYLHVLLYDTREQQFY
jgi:hypothetical protein